MHLILCPGDSESIPADGRIQRSGLFRAEGSIGGLNRCFMSHDCSTETISPSCATSLFSSVAA
eukprot:762995-Hanusia_phi.AAC.1